MKFKNKEKAKRIKEKILMCLYDLEDLNEYRKNSLNKIIELVKKIRIE